MARSRIKSVKSFLDAVSPEPNTGCWLWTGKVDRSGYGLFELFQGEEVLAHRYAFELFCPRFAAGVELDHRCGVRSCVNPLHLRVSERAARLASPGLSPA
ncbi:MAG TPA: HNH endonuclease [Anaeromyxobacteraceae bacterium]|nr:HNH endonuclease [Anaeromyxobacteraceae bacterium]